MKKTTSKKANQTKNELIDSAILQLIEAAKKAIQDNKEEWEIMEDIMEAAKNTMWGDWDSFVANTSDWINAQVNDANLEQVWNQIDNSIMNTIISLARQL